LTRKKHLQSHTFHTETEFGHLYVIISEDNDNPYELFAIIGKSGDEIAAITEAIGRLVSLCFKSSIDIVEVYKQLHGIVGKSKWTSEGNVLSIPDGVARCIRYYMESKNIEIKDEDSKTIGNNDEV